MARILLIDDDTAFSGKLRGELEKRGYGVTWLGRAEGGPDVLATGEFDLVLLDNQLPGMSGTDFLDALRQGGIRVPVILVTGYATADTAIEATKLGAFGYVTKTRELLAELEPLIRRALEIDWRGERVRLPGHPAADGKSGSALLGQGKPMQRVYGQIGQAAAGDGAVLIHGETGTEKELVARAICSHGARNDRPFVVVNCTARNEEELDDELFGHEPGASPGGDRFRKGSFEHADGGTLFLDELADLPLRDQAKVVGVLKNKEVFRRGGSEAIKVNVRLLAATHHDLKAATDEGRFLGDLYYLNWMEIVLPPLRDRGPDDLRLLAEQFLTRVAESTGRARPPLSEGAWERLRKHSWPGNILELHKVIGGAALCCRGSQIGEADVQSQLRASGEGEVIDHLRRAIVAALRSGQTNIVPRLRGLLHQELLLLALEECAGDQEEAARILGVPLKGLLNEAAHEPETAAKSEKLPGISFQAQALVLIHNHPEWTAGQYAEELGCSRTTLYRDPIIRAALKRK
jgi:DNA-binding NtrC family response regulator